MKCQRISSCVAFAVLCVSPWFGCGAANDGTQVQDEAQGGAGGVGGQDEPQVAEGGAGGALFGTGGLGGIATLPGSGGSSVGGAGGSSASGGAGGNAASAGASANLGGAAGSVPFVEEDPPAGYVRGAVGVGYGGIRILSRDGGKTWTKTGEIQQRGGDDGNLLRSVAFGNKLWVAGGWDKWFTSPNGSDWTMRSHNHGIIQGLAYGNKMFIASTIDGNILRSTDGLAWTGLGNAGMGKHSRVVFGNGLFAVSGDPGKTVTSSDGTKWQSSSVPNVVAFCGGQFNTNRSCYGDLFNAGFWVQGTWLREISGGIQLSSDGKAWKPVFQPGTNGIDDLFIGWVPGP